MRKRRTSQRPDAIGTLAKDVKIQASQKKKLTRHALGLPIATFLIGVLCIRNLFSLISIKKGKNALYSTVDMCLGILAIIMLECDRFYHIDPSYNREQIIAQQLGLKKFFSASTAYRFINSFAGWHINQLEKVNDILLKKHSNALKQKKKVIDIDCSTHPFSGRKREKATPGYNKKDKGGDCYQNSAIFCAFECVYQMLDAGHLHCSQRLKSLIEKAEKKLGEIYALRIDSGYFSKDSVEYLASIGFLFVLCVSANCKGYQDALALAKRGKLHFKKVGRYRNTYVAELRDYQVLAGLDKTFRFLFVKELKEIKKVKKGRIYWKKEWQYFGLITSIPHREMCAQQLVRFYRQRQTIENYFKEIKHSFNASKMPSAKFRGNEAYLWFVAIAYNCSLWFKRDVLSRKHQNSTMKTLRRKLDVEAEFKIKNGFILLIFEKDYQYIRLYIYIFQRLRALQKRHKTPPCRVQSHATKVAA